MEYITKIESIAGKLKNITLKGEVTRKRVFELENMLFLFLTLQDDTGSIEAILYGERTQKTLAAAYEIEEENWYHFRGNVMKIKETFLEDLNHICSEKEFLNQYPLGENLFFIKHYEFGEKRKEDTFGIEVSSILNHDLSVIASRPVSGSFPLLLYFLEEFGIQKQNTMKLFSLEGTSTWYTVNLLSLFSGIPKDTVHSYFYPCLGASKKSEKIDPKKFLRAIETLQKSKIYLCDFSFVIDENTDIVDLILGSAEYEEPYDFILIHPFDELVKKSKYDGEEILRKLKSYAKEKKCHILLFSCVNREAEEKEKPTLCDISLYPILKKFVTQYLLSWKNDSLDPSFCFLMEREGTSKIYQVRYQKENYQREEIKKL